MATLVACSQPPATTQPVASVSVVDPFLQALVADLAFFYPDEARLLQNGLLRSAFARAEASHLGLEVDPEVVESGVSRAIGAMRDALPEGMELEDWILERYRVDAPTYREALRNHLADNQLYQMAMRSRALQAGRVRLRMLATLDPDLAEDWKRRLEHGASFAHLARESLEPGPDGDGRQPPLPLDLPEPLASALAAASPGDLVGPLRLEGDRVQRVFLVEEFLEPVDPLGRAALLASLEEQPPTALEARAWFEAMVRRYTAAPAKLPVMGPEEPFGKLQRTD